MREVTRSASSWRAAGLAVNGFTRRHGSNRTAEGSGRRFRSSALIYHAFTDYLRDYELIMYATADPRTGIQPAYLRYLFKYCVEANVESALRTDGWQRSLDERLIDHDLGKGLDGLVWGVKWQRLYPGLRVVAKSRRARQWAKDVGIDFHEVRIETEVTNICLVFSDLIVSDLTLGYAPFVLREELA